MFRLKFFYSIFALLLFVLNVSLGNNVVDVEHNVKLKANTEEVTTITQTSSDSQQYGLQPSVMYSAIDRNYRADRPHRRKFLFDMSMCFSESGAFAFLTVIAVVNFYKLFVKNNLSHSFLSLPKIVNENSILCKPRYCEISSVLII